MKKNLIKQIIFFLLLSTLVLGKDALPNSRQATLLENTSPSEVMVRATGIGIGKKKGIFDKVTAQELNKKAELDAEKAAIWFLLMGSNEPLLQTDQEKGKFTEIQQDFFKKDNIEKFIVWEAQYFENRIKLEEHKLKIVKDYKINSSLLREALVNRNILQERSRIQAKVGLPSIMVFPAQKGDTPPFELLQNNSDYKIGAQVIQSYLTARQYEVILPEQQQQMQEQVAAQFALSGTAEDYSYLLALSIGSDVYITYNISISSRKVGSTTVKKATVGCQAYETTTSRLLGTETGYSEERRAPDKVLIEEAMHGAVNSVLGKINAYWKNDIQQGLQYKIKVKVNQVYSTDESEEIMFALADIYENISENMKEEGFGDYTYDVRLWIDPDKFDSATGIYREIKTNYKGPGDVERVTLTGKLILLKIEPNY